MDRELHFSYDNDLFFGTDRYYTSGADITYARIINKGSLYERFKGKNDSSKVIARIQYGHKIFTPQKLTYRDPARFDRPYAGWHYLKFHIQNHPGPNVSNKYMLELGMVGDRSGIGNFHTWWHDKLNFPTPRGWQYEVGNEVIINAAYNRKMLWSPIKRIGLYSDTGIKIGNGINRVTQEFAIRYGKAGRLFNSAAAKSRISKHMPVVGNNDPEEEEGFVFYGIEGQYVLSNIFIEGSILNKENTQQSELETYVIIRKWGFMYSNYYTTFSFTFYRMSREIVGAKSHRYLSLDLSFRF